MQIVPVIVIKTVHIVETEGNFLKMLKNSDQITIRLNGETIPINQSQKADKDASYYLYNKPLYLWSWSIYIEKRDEV